MKKNIDKMTGDELTREVLKNMQGMSEVGKRNVYIRALELTVEGLKTLRKNIKTVLIFDEDIAFDDLPLERRIRISYVKEFTKSVGGGK